MNKSLFSRLSIPVLFATTILMLGGSFFAIAHQVTANEAQNNTAVATELGSSFTYQGELIKDGTPLNDTCSMKFQLFDAQSEGNAVSAELTKSIQLSTGTFTVDLDFGNTPFTGEARYLNIAVQCSGDASYTNMENRVALNATPYALSLRPGAVVKGIDTGATAALTGWAEETVLGAIGLYGYGSSSLSSSYGVYGETSGSGAGVLGYGNYIGIEGHATESTGINYGVYGSSPSPSGYGLYSEGNAHVAGLISWQPITSYVTLSSSAFRPSAYSNTFINDGELYSLDSNSTVYAADVQLPNNATVTKLTYNWVDADTLDNSDVAFHRKQSDGTDTIMATVSSSGDANTYDSTSTTTITDATIDNATSGYYLRVWFPGSGLHRLVNVTIEYTIDQPH